MTKLLSHALERVQGLSSSDQDRIACDLTRYVDDLQRLRVELREGTAFLDAGKGKELDIESVIARANISHGYAAKAAPLVSRSRNRSSSNLALGRQPFLG